MADAVTTADLTKPTTEQMIEIMQAYVNGAHIQVAHRTAGCKWHDLLEPAIHPTWDWLRSIYRVKPVPPPTPISFDGWRFIHSRYKWMASDENGSIYVYVNKPCVGVHKWMGHGDYARVNALTITRGTVHWKDSLIARPEGV